MTPFSVTLFALAALLLACSSDADEAERLPDVVFERQLSSELGLRIVVRRIQNPAPVTLPSSKPNAVWAQGAVEVQYVLTRASDGHVVTRLKYIVRTEDGPEAFRFLGAALCEQRLVILEQWMPWTSVVTASFDPQTGAIGPLTRLPTGVKESEVNGPRIIGGAVIKCDATGARVRWDVANGPSLEREVKWESAP